MAGGIEETDASYWILPSGFFEGEDLLSGVALEINDGIVCAISAVDNLPDGARLVRSRKIVSEGFFDLQVNGGGGVMLNSTPTPEGIEKIAVAHLASGTTSLLPTVITDTPEITRRAALAVLESHGRFGVRGIHIEGPHINPERKGTHNPDLIRPFDEQTMELLKLLRANNLPVLLTLAPETVPDGTIAALSEIGVVVAAGHTNATADQIETALAEGLGMFTHLFNGMSQMTAREPGVVGSALSSKASIGIIVDGHHVDERMIKLAFAVGSSDDRMCVVSDAMATWRGPDHFVLYGEKIHVDNGRLINNQGSLAGAHIDMCRSFSNLLDMEIQLETALGACTSSPKKAMRLDQAVNNLPNSALTRLISFDPEDPVETVQIMEVASRARASEMRKSNLNTGAKFGETLDRKWGK